MSYWMEIKNRRIVENSPNSPKNSCFSESVLGIEICEIVYEKHNYYITSF